MPNIGHGGLNMKAMKKNDMGVSPVIAVILMVAITVVLAGVVFLWAQSFTDDTGGTVETLNIKATATSDGTDNYLIIEVMGGSVDFTKYQVKLTEVGDPTNSVTFDSTDLDVPATTTYNAGDTASFTSTSGTDLLTLITTGNSMNVKIINIGDNKIVWENDLRVTNA